MKALVVGGGIMGLSCALALARAAHAVTLLERGVLPNPLASSVDRNRLIRYPYGAQEGYTRMVGEAFGAWERLWLDLGERYYVETGTLALSAGGDDWVGSSRVALGRSGIAYRRLGAAELGERVPMLNPAGVTEAIYLESGGFLRAAEIVAALAAHLPKLGVSVLAETEVVALDAGAARVSLRSGRELAADRLVVAAGPWTPKLLPQFARRVTASRQLVVYLEPPTRWARAWANAPMVLEIGADAGFYAVPPRGPHGLKLGDHRFSLRGDPDGERAAADEEAEAIVRAGTQRFRDAGSYRKLEAKTCFYDVSENERFLVEPLGERSWVLSGFSGHGFKFGALIGERIADAIAGRIDPQALTRWAAGEAELLPPARKRL
ncbi:MAG: FAD-dependent oxidoreductase [Burkholderiales bacterium]